MLGKIADLAETFGAMRSETEISRLDLIGEIEEEQPHGFAERDGRNHKHQALDPQGRKPDSAGDCAGDDSRGTKGWDQ